MPFDLLIAKTNVSQLLPNDPLSTFSFKSVPFYAKRDNKWDLNDLFL
jgi:hypothetical protein